MERDRNKDSKREREVREEKERQTDRQTEARRKRLKTLKFLCSSSREGKIITGTVAVTVWL